MEFVFPGKVLAVASDIRSDAKHKPELHFMINLESDEVCNTTLSLDKPLLQGSVLKEECWALKNAEWRGPKPDTTAWKMPTKDWQKRWHPRMNNP